MLVFKKRAKLRKILELTKYFQKKLAQSALSYPISTLHVSCIHNASSLHLAYSARKRKLDVS